MAGQSKASPDGVSTCPGAIPFVASNPTVAGISITSTVSMPAEEHTRLVCGPEKS